MRRTIGGKTIDTGGNGRECDRCQTVFATKLNRARIAGGEQLILAAVTAVPYWTDGMDHMPGRQPVSSGDLGIASFAAAQRAAFLKQLAAGRAMDRTINAAAAQQRAICSVDDCIDAQCHDVGDDDFKPRFADQAYHQVQATVETGTPLSAKSCCNSPA